ncbi:relaxase/mobilization nuclease domain-containing protein [Paraburkholderia bryophila]|uniref:relaxase/mobilization nuclease domain-containing protein n=1 Tax=Paraburkholderia bryophila TaxID=420952 RepID=UPI0038B6CFA0
MIVRVFKAGISRGESPVNYLMSDRDHTGQKRAVAPEILEGSADLTIAVINNIQRKHKYVSGAIAFRDNEQPTREQMKQVIQSFKQSVCPGLGPKHFNSLFVLHLDKGNTEIHFVIPMVEMTTGKRMNIHPPGKQNIKLYEAFTQVTNHQLGYAQVVPDPLKLALSDFERHTPEGKTDRSNKLYLHKRLTRAIRTGQVANRDQLCDFLSEQYGVEITRKGADYLSLKFPGAAKAKRFRGPLYNENANYAELVSSARNTKQEHHLSPSEYQQARTTLSQHVESRRQFNVKAYLSPRVLRSQRFKATRERQTYKPITTNRKETSSMKSQFSGIKLIARQILQEAKAVHATRPTTWTTRDKAAVIGSMQSMREQAMHGADTTSDLSVFSDIEAAIGEVQSNINAATADVNSARTPKQRSEAERRLAKLMEQKSRLKMQLGQARIRQLNSLSGMKRN